MCSGKDWLGDIAAAPVTVAKAKRSTANADHVLCIAKPEFLVAGVDDLSVTGFMIWMALAGLCDKMMVWKLAHFHRRIHD